MKTEFENNYYEIYESMSEGRTLKVQFDDDIWTLCLSEDGYYDITSRFEEDYSVSYDDLDDALRAIRCRGEIIDFWF